MKWFRLYNEVLHDSKVQTLSPELFRAWVNLLCVASDAEDRGTLPSLAQIAFSLRVKEEKARQIIDRLLELQLLDETEDGVLTPHNWTVRQPEGDSSANRVKRYRQKIRANGETVTGYTKHRAEVFTRDGRACVYCSSTKTLVLDHLVPVSRGGVGDPDNLVTACKSCNAGKAGRLVGEAGYTFRNAATLNQYMAALSRFGVTDEGIVNHDTCSHLSQPVTVTVTPVTSLEEIRLEREKKREEKTPPTPLKGDEDEGEGSTEETALRSQRKSKVPLEKLQALTDWAREVIGKRGESEFYFQKIRGWACSYPLEWIETAILCTAAGAEHVDKLASHTNKCLINWHPDGPPKAERETAERQRSREAKSKAQDDAFDRLGDDPEFLEACNQIKGVQ